jgi:hypothetical protein
MRFSGCGQCCSCRFAALRRAFDDSLSLHVSDLREDSKDQFADTFSDPAEAMDIDGNTALDQISNSALNIERITTKAINGVHIDRVAFANVLQ